MPGARITHRRSGPTRHAPDAAFPLCGPAATKPKSTRTVRCRLMRRMMGPAPGARGARTEERDRPSRAIPTGPLPLGRRLFCGSCAGEQREKIGRISKRPLLAQTLLRGRRSDRRSRRGQRLGNFRAHGPRTSRFIPFLFASLGHQPARRFRLWVRPTDALPLGHTTS